MLWIRRVREIADRVSQVPLAPRDLLNAYLVGDVLVDAGVPQTARRLLDAVRGRDVSALLITHAHPDHAGGAKRVAEELGVPIWSSRIDSDALQRGRPVPRPGLVLGPLLSRNGWPAVHVDRCLDEGDDVTGFTVLDVPGHSPGHLALWREEDRTLVAGDVFFNVDFRTLRAGLRKPLKIVTVNGRQNRDSMRRLVELEPAVTVFGHGPAHHGPLTLPDA